MQNIRYKSDAVTRIATGFGGGVSRLGSICGALSGTIMAMGLVEGRNDPSDNDAKLKLYKKVIILINDFKDEFGTVDCRELTGCDLLTEEGLAKFAEKKIHEEVCPKYVEFAASRGIKILKNNR